MHVDANARVATLLRVVKLAGHGTNVAMDARYLLALGLDLLNANNVGLLLASPFKKAFACR
jgi:L-lactate permease